MTPCTDAVKLLNGYRVASQLWCCGYDLLVTGHFCCCWSSRIKIVLCDLRIELRRSASASDLGQLV